MARHSCLPQSVASILRGVDAPFEVLNDQVVITGITQDSRAIQPGDIYCCIRGENFDGHSFVSEAIASGAVALIVDREIETLPNHVSVVHVDDVRRFVGYFAASLFGFPARSLQTIGVTGTNGKTTTTAMIASIVETSGLHVRQIGTLTGARTTPEAIDIQAQLRRWADEGVQCVVMEVSSHALVQHRVNGMIFDISVFTNIGRDHLDFHGTDEAYFAAKAMLFEENLSRCGVVNTDDPKGLLLKDAMAIPMIGYSSSDAHNVTMKVDAVSYQWNSAEVFIPMGGSFTLMNSLAAATVAATMGISTDAIADGLRHMKHVPGRFEPVQNTCGIGVIVDYAHTPDSLTLLLKSVKEVCAGRVIVVFGCGGNRDSGKRPMMGQVAASLADVVIVTSDNPRSEDPEAIIDEVCGEISDPHATILRMVDREQAIESAISEARRDDIVVIAGKGHETTQEISNVFHPFSDVDVAKKFLNLREETTE